MATGRIEIGPTGRTVAQNLKRLREARNLSLRALSALVTEMGRPLSVDALNKIEKGAVEGEASTRRVDVDDLVALAAALRVNPSALLLPPMIEGEAQLTAAGTWSGRAAWAWVDGRSPLVESGTADYADEFADFQLHARPRGFRAYLKGTSSGGHRAELPARRDEDGNVHLVDLEDAPRDERSRVLDVDVPKG